ncbi:MAG TPA: hypothetical protein VLL52_09195 [Anaerolineae bacterium]|nr:hypothetical protein [Anaerolineae bacterium]
MNDNIMSTDSTTEVAEKTEKSKPTITPEHTQQAQAIAATLQEDNSEAIGQIARLIAHMGAEWVNELLAEILEIEKNGGIMTRNGKRRRTAGGAYLHLARQRVPRPQRRVIWPRKKQKKNKKQIPPFPWEERVPFVHQALKGYKGEVTVKVTLVGRPGKIIERQQLIITPVTGKPPATMPNGLPEIKDKKPVYLVYIARKQWSRVETALKDPDDKIIVQGYPFYDKQFKVISVLAQSTTTVNLQRAQREKKQQD